jgi:hypothetical protein
MWTLLAVACLPPLGMAAPPRLVLAQAEPAAVAVDGLVDEVRVVARAGSAHDPPGREGIAWIAANILADRLGAVVEVGEDVVRLAVPIGAAGTLGEALTRPVEGDELERARSKADAWLLGADCGTVAEAAWVTWAYAGHPYGHPTVGRSSVRASLTEGEVSSFIARHYVRESVRVGVAPSGAPAVGGLGRLAPVTLPHATPATRAAVDRGLLLVVAPALGPCAVAGVAGARPPFPTPPDVLGPALRGGPLASARVEPWDLRRLDVTLESPVASAIAAAAGLGLAGMSTVVVVEAAPTREEMAGGGVQAVIRAEDLFR